MTGTQAGAKSTIRNFAKNALRANSDFKSPALDIAGSIRSQNEWHIAELAHGSIVFTLAAFYAMFRTRQTKQVLNNNMPFLNKTNIALSLRRQIEAFLTLVASGFVFANFAVLRAVGAGSVQRKEFSIKTMIAANASPGGLRLRLIG